MQAQLYDWEREPPVKFRRHRKEEDYYASKRTPSDGMVLAGPPKPDLDTWRNSSLGAWLPQEKRAEYLAELAGENVSNDL